MEKVRLIETLAFPNKCPVISTPAARLREQRAPVDPVVIRTPRSVHRNPREDTSVRRFSRWRRAAAKLLLFVLCSGRNDPQITRGILLLFPPNWANTLRLSHCPAFSLSPCPMTVDGNASEWSLPFPRTDTSVGDVECTSDKTHAFAGRYRHARASSWFATTTGRSFLRVIKERAS